MTKILYVLSRDISLFSLPGLRKIRNFAYSRHLKVSGLNVDSNVKIQALHHNPLASINIGNELHVGADCVIDLSGIVKIGNRVTVSEGAKIYTHSHPIDGGGQDWRQNKLSFSELTIEDDVWIGAGAIVLSSVTYIGKGSVIAAGSVVRHDVESMSVVAGIPSRFIRKRQVSFKNE